VSEAAALIGLGPTQRGEVGANARLRRAPCGPAIEVYIGVLYEALDAASLGARARGRLDEHVAIASALWGLVRPSDAIPAYRLSGGASLPGLGTLSSVWREPIRRELSSSEGLVVDLRSAVYVGLGPLPAAVAPRSASVRVLTQKGRLRTVVSHNNKATKGRIVRALLQSRDTPTTDDALAEAISTAGFDVEHAGCGHDGAEVLDVIVSGV
jgi:cytoplasmic iron level regulating protein YaaA (DUF328/UPF0246 family)